MKVKEHHVDWTHLLGKGSFGEVFRGCLNNGVACAVKCALDQEDAEMLRSEGEIGKTLRHENILTVYDVFVARGRQCVSLELCDLGDLRQYIDHLKHSRADARVCTALLQTRQLLSAVLHLHASGFMHRDIKPANILMKDDGNGATILKLADFGLVVSNNEWVYEFAGTVSYMSPEQLDSWCQTCCDVWAVGAVMYELLQLEDLIPGDLDDEHDVSGFSVG